MSLFDEILDAIAEVVLAIVEIIFLTFEAIINWFDSFRSTHEIDKDAVGFTIKKHIEEGDYEVIQGVFNKKTEKVVEGRAIQGDTVDTRVAAAHAKKSLVIYD